MDRRAAQDKLRRWAEANAERDEVVRDAAAAGVSVRQIGQVTGISRSDILRILARGPRRPPLRLVYGARRGPADQD